ncbi:hypothetical protein EJ05DRAFT_464436 [Pseudovirgaria hyperparasitica]|uniref:Prolyl 4-hydroxylase alpha subunit domain-containing protein n=1 Tax=Pseudovirgaria hyperparasitica TaxID=470096 RepID=A0A6A6WBU6_9PEZI|nr:uncharacterized protein EJ05DRAFT_464436 [Pseudovirgaria hyperparasitica]KAF2758581.1 hypothetical protein EJ05DRAFT_464436 [Pseudovirgaria hyperparasitica]
MLTTTSAAPVWSTKHLLTSPPPDITIKDIDFDDTNLSGAKYGGLDAKILDNVLTAAECAALIAVAETVGHWERAMVNIGNGKQALYTDTRNCGRIIWDDKEIVNRLWQRVKPHIEPWTRLEGRAEVTGNGPAKRKEVWRATRLNERMRFLKYVGGEFFRPHCDGTYETPDRKERSYYTLHLYLNDAMNAAPGERPLQGGATVFHDYTMRERYEVVPKVGRVLVFQHRSLLHSGDDVVQGTKYTLRTDIMYELDSMDGNKVDK